MTAENRIYLAIILVGTGIFLPFGTLPALFFATTAILSVLSVSMLRRGVERMVGAATKNRHAGPIAQIGMVLKVPAFCALAYFAAKQGIPSVIAFLAGLLSVYSAFVWAVYAARPPKS